MERDMLLLGGLETLLDAPLFIVLLAEFEGFRGKTEDRLWVGFRINAALTPQPRGLT